MSGFESRTEPLLQVMNKSVSSLVGAGWLLLLAAPHSHAKAVPALINYQGKFFSSNGLPVSASCHPSSLRIYDSVTNGNLICGPQIVNDQSGPAFDFPELVTAERTMLVSSLFCARMRERSQSLLTSLGRRPSLNTGSTSFSTSPTRSI